MFIFVSRTICSDQTPFKSCMIVLPYTLSFLLPLQLTAIVVVPSRDPAWHNDNDNDNVLLKQDP